MLDAPQHPDQSFQLVTAILEVRIPPSALWYLSNKNFSEVAAAPRPDTLITGADQSEESCGFMPKL